MMRLEKTGMVYSTGRHVQHCLWWGS